MKRQTSLFWLALVCFAMLQTSCEPTLTPKAGKKVQFSVTAKNGMKTKTQYSGVVTDGFERISWVSGDKIRIVSSDATKVATPSGGNAYDYTVSAVSDRGRFSDASLADAPGTNGLVWSGDDVTGVYFFGSYPAVEYAFPTGKQAPVFQHMTIPAEPGLNWNGNTGSPDMAQAYLLSAPAQYSSEEGKVHLDFYPVFNAFEIDLTSKDGTLELKQLQLISTSSNLAGTFNFNSSDNSDAYNINADGPVLGGIDILPSSASKTLTVNLSGKTISNAADGHVHFTILALPGDLTDITLAVTFVDPKDSTKEKTRRLKLQQNGSFITFPAFGKARLNGLALDNGENWLLTIQTDVNEWELVEKTTTFSEQIGIRGLTVSGMTETGNHEMGNEEAAGTDAYYARYYQIRTLDMSVENPHFVIKFTPFAPIGGYWLLEPQGIGEGSLQHFDVKHYLGEGIYNDELIGQVMGTEVEIHIFPKDFDPSAGESYAIILKSFFSAQRTFDEAFSADSEFQDVHGDGRYSYWRFTLPSSN